jgi:hypothetical protein
MAKARHEFETKRSNLKKTNKIALPKTQGLDSAK